MTTESAFRKAGDLRTDYDDQIRTRLVAHHPDTETVEQIGPLWRKTVDGGRGFITYRDLGGLTGKRLDELITAQRDHFAALGSEVEWRFHDDDEPGDLRDRLSAAGFAPEAAETLMLGEAAELAIAPRLPESVTLRELSATADLERVRLVEEAVWGVDHAWLPEALAGEIASSSDPVVVIGAEHGEDLVGAAWIRMYSGTRFAGLWGGSTMPDWRGRGVYRAMVARRAQIALARGFDALQVDASPASAAVLTHLGMHAVAETVPYVWRPAQAKIAGAQPQ